MGISPRRVLKQGYGTQYRSVCDCNDLEKEKYSARVPDAIILLILEVVVHLKIYSITITG